jgi:1-deoxy-D-xylulose-5-phosphate reductoisomerase
VDVLALHADRFRVVGLATGRQADVLDEQVARLRPAIVALGDAAAARRLDLPSGTGRIGGPAALEEIATHPDVDLVVVGTGGIVSLRPVLAALRAGKIVATANTETLVAGGHLVMPLARDLARARAAARADDPLASPLAWLRPIDSEHSAIWQCLVGEQMSAVARLVLTASGGPFLDASAEELAAATAERALRHPTWTMGAKVTIDSATLANKGLEVIEAHWLYDVGYDAIDVVIHPQSVVHSAVTFADGSMKAQLGTPDMRLPIQYALTYPERLASPVAPADLVATGRLEFRAPDEARFPALPIAREAGRRGPRAAPDRRRRGRRCPVPGRDARIPRHPGAPRGCGRAVRRNRGGGSRRRGADRSRR